MMFNIICLIRIILIPFFLYFLLWGNFYLAIIIFILTIFLDLLSEQTFLIERKEDKTKKLGNYLTDRILIILMALVLYLKGILFFWQIVLIMARDIGIISGYVFIKSKRKIDIKPNYLGRTGTFLILFSFVILMTRIVGWMKISDLGMWLFYLALFVYLLSGLIYLKKGFEIYSGRPFFKSVKRTAETEKKEAWF